MEVALRKRASQPTLAHRRADLSAQIREMALTDLKNVSKRLKALHTELEEKEGRRWTHYQLAEGMKIPPRTFQSWENGEVENRNGEGYDKMVRWYSKRLGRKITRNWVLFGEGEAKAPTPDVMGQLNGSTEADEQLREILGGILERQTELLSKVESVLAEQERLRKLLPPDESSEEEPPGN